MSLFTVNKDILRQIFLLLDYRDIAAIYCSARVPISIQQLRDDQGFWYQLIRKNYPEGEFRGDNCRLLARQSCDICYKYYDDHTRSYMKAIAFGYVELIRLIEANISRYSKSVDNFCPNSCLYSFSRGAKKHKFCGKECYNRPPVCSICSRKHSGILLIEQHKLEGERWDPYKIRQEVMKKRLAEEENMNVYSHTIL